MGGKPESGASGHLTLSDYRRERAAEMAEEEERKLEDIKDKVTAGQATIQAQAEQMEVMLESLDKGGEAERQLAVRITDKNVELKAENRTLKAKLEKAYDFMRQFTINGMNMLEHFLRSIGEWVQQKVAGMSR